MMERMPGWAQRFHAATMLQELTGEARGERPPGRCCKQKSRLDILFQLSLNLLASMNMINLPSTYARANNSMRYLVGE
jgi:hypothetical protein